MFPFHRALWLAISWPFRMVFLYTVIAVCSHPYKAAAVIWAMLLFILSTIH